MSAGLAMRQQRLPCLLRMQLQGVGLEPEHRTGVSRSRSRPRSVPSNWSRATCSPRSVSASAANWYHPVSAKQAPRISTGVMGSVGLLECRLMSARLLLGFSSPLGERLSPRIGHLLTVARHSQPSDGGARRHRRCSNRSVSVRCDDENCCAAARK